MQARIPLFGTPSIQRLDAAGTIQLLDLRSTADRDVTRYVTLYAQVYRETPAGGSALFATFFGETFSGYDQLASSFTLFDSNPTPIRILDQYPVRGDEVLTLLYTPSAEIAGMVWGFYTTEGVSDQKTVLPNTGLPSLVDWLSVERSDRLDKRPLQPDNTVPEAATLSVEAPLAADTSVPVHVVPTTSPYLDEVTVDVCMQRSTEARLFFAGYPDNFVFLRPIAIAPGERGSTTGLQKALDGIPFRAEGVLEFLAVTADEDPAALASGFFVRY